MARLAAHASQTGPMIYTAHGFHFLRGRLWKNWLFYYPMEKFFSRYTDQQICINRKIMNWRSGNSMRSMWIMCREWG